MAIHQFDKKLVQKFFFFNNFSNWKKVIIIECEKNIIVSQKVKGKKMQSHKNSKSEKEIIMLEDRLLSKGRTLPRVSEDVRKCECYKKWLIEAA